MQGGGRIAAGHHDLEALRPFPQQADQLRLRDHGAAGGTDGLVQHQKIQIAGIGEGILKQRGIIGGGPGLFFRRHGPDEAVRLSADAGLDAEKAQRGQLGGIAIL